MSLLFTLSGLSVSLCLSLSRLSLSLSLSPLSLSHTHTRARAHVSLRSSSIWTLILLIKCEVTVRLVSHFTTSFGIMHELHKFKLFVYFVVEFSVSCVVSSLVDTTSPKPYQQVKLMSIVIAQFVRV